MFWPFLTLIVYMLACIYIILLYIESFLSTVSNSRGEREDAERNANLRL